MRKGDKDNPGETMKCYDDKADARAYLGALYANVVDVMKELFNVQPTVGDLLESHIHKSFTVVADVLYGLGYLDRDERIRLSGSIGDSLDVLDKAIDEMGLDGREVDPSVAAMLVGRGMSGSMITTYKDVSTEQDRWLAVSTAEEWDLQGEMFTTKAMDYDIERAKSTGVYPELRLYHVRGFKLGMCDSMERIGQWAVDQGYWFDTPFAQAVKDLVAANKGRWKVSRGFYAIRAAGSCARCEKDLPVGLLNYVFGVKCDGCGAYHPKPNALGGLRVLKSMTYDITVTDVPAVGSTAIAAFSITE